MFLKPQPCCTSADQSSAPQHHAMCHQLLMLGCQLSHVLILFLNKASVSVFLQKPSKAADLDLPPHMLNKPATAAPGASSRPPLSHQSSTSASHKATVLPIPMTGPSSSSKSKKTHDQSPGKSHAKPSEEESPASSRASTPSGKGKLRSQEGRAVNGRLDPPVVSSPTPARKVVPIKLDRGPRQTEQQAGPSRQSSDAIQSAATSNDAQVRYQRDCSPMLLFHAEHASASDTWRVVW